MNKITLQSWLLLYTLILFPHLQVGWGGCSVDGTCTMMSTIKAENTVAIVWSHLPCSCTCTIPSGGSIRQLWQSPSTTIAYNPATKALPITALSSHARQSPWGSPCLFSLSVCFPPPWKLVYISEAALMVAILLQFCSVIDIVLSALN